MYYIEQICTPDQMVRVTIHPEEITRPLMYRKYKKATPGNPLMIERLDGCMVYVDARELARRAYAMARAAKSGDCGKQTGDFMWLLFTLAGVRGTENIIEEIKAAEKAAE